MAPYDVENAFTYHPPLGNQPRRYAAIREAAKNLAHTIVHNCPDSAERTLSLRELEIAVMRANQSIALNESRTLLGPDQVPPSGPA
jgi:hypothetical protein